MRSSLALVIAGCTFVAAVAQAASPNVVISEFRTRGPNGSGDEFVELWNKSMVATDISGWLLRATGANGATTVRATVPAGTSLGSGCYYLFGNVSALGYSGATGADQAFTVGIADDGRIEITEADQSIVDQVAMQPGGGEGTSLAPLVNNADQSYERAPGGRRGNAQDTDDNATDFIFHSNSSRPQNRNSCMPTRVLDWTWGQVKTIYR